MQIMNMIEHMRERTRKKKKKKMQEQKIRKKKMKNRRNHFTFKVIVSKARILKNDNAPKFKIHLLWVQVALVLFCLYDIKES